MSRDLPESFDTFSVDNAPSGRKFTAGTITGGNPFSSGVTGYAWIDLGKGIAGRTIDISIEPDLFVYDAFGTKTVLPEIVLYDAAVFNVGTGANGQTVLIPVTGKAIRITISEDRTNFDPSLSYGYEGLFFEDMVLKAAGQKDALGTTYSDRYVVEVFAIRQILPDPFGGPDIQLSNRFSLITADGVSLGGDFRDVVFGTGWLQTIKATLPDFTPPVVPTPTTPLPEAALPKSLAESPQDPSKATFESQPFHFDAARSRWSTPVAGDLPAGISTRKDLLESIGASAGDLVAQALDDLRALKSDALDAAAALRDKIGGRALFDSVIKDEVDVTSDLIDMIESDGSSRIEDFKRLEEGLDARIQGYRSGGVLFYKLFDAGKYLFDSVFQTFSNSDLIYKLGFDINDTKPFIQFAAGHHDVFIGSGTSDNVNGGDLSDALLGGAGNDTLFGGTGNDVIAGDGGQDYLRGDEGDDFLSGGADFDDANGNMGNDTVSTGDGDDYCVGGKDNDSLDGGAGYDLVYGNLGNDTCIGGDGNDIVRGGQDNDLVIGGNGDDFVSGDKGSDTMTGGAGADIFHTFGDAGIDRVTDFSRAQGDRVQLDPGTQYTVTQVGADTVISMMGGGQMILVGVQMSTLTPGWIFGA